MLISSKVHFEFLWLLLCSCEVIWLVCPFVFSIIRHLKRLCLLILLECWNTGLGQSIAFSFLTQSVGSTKLTQIYTNLQRYVFLLSWIRNLYLFITWQHTYLKCWMKSELVKAEALHCDSYDRLFWQITNSFKIVLMEPQKSVLQTDIYQTKCRRCARMAIKIKLCYYLFSNFLCSFRNTVIWVSVHYKLFNLSINTVLMYFLEYPLKTRLIHRFLSFTGVSHVCLWRVSFTHLSVLLTTIYTTLYLLFVTSCCTSVIHYWRSAMM